MSFFPLAESRKGSLCRVCETNLCDVISPFARVVFYRRLTERVANSSGVCRKMTENKRVENITILY